MVIVGPVAHDDVGLPLADEPGDLLPVLQRRHQLAVVDVEHRALDAEDLPALGHFRLPPLRQRAAGLFEMADIAVGHGDELDLVPGRRPHRRHAARLELGVVGMRAEGDYAEWSLSRLVGLNGRMRDGDSHQEARQW